MRSGRGALALVLTSVLAAAAAALAGGAVEAVRETRGLVMGLGAIGFAALLAVPLGLVLSLALRGLWRAWRPGELAAALTDPETGGAPRLAAWLLFLALGAVVLGTALLRGMNWLEHATAAVAVHILVAAILAVGTAGVLAAVSRPVVRGLAGVLSAIDRASVRRLGRSVLAPRWVAAGAAALAVVLLVLAWFLSIRPLIGSFDLRFLPSVIVWAAVLVSVPAGWSWLARHPRWLRPLAGALCAAGLCAALGAALWLRAERPAAMLEIWGEAHLSGLAIDILCDVSALRGSAAAPIPRPGASHPDLVLVTIDTLRADHTPLHGGTAKMPVLSELGREGAVFDWAFSPSNVTRRSLPAIAMGVSAPRLRGRVAGWALKLDPRHVLLAERLRAGGYDTAGFFCCRSQFGAEHELGLIRGIDHVELEKDGVKLAHMAAKWLARRAARHPRRPLFLWVHFIEPHRWAHAHRTANGSHAVGPRYDLSLADADRALGTLLESVWAPARRGHTYIVVTADHGESLGEHGFPYHSTSTYDSETHVPLVVVGPGVAARRIEHVTSLVGVAPTLLDLGGFVPPGMPSMDGRSFAPLVLGKVADVARAGEAYIAMIRDRSVPYGERTVVEGRYKLIARDKGGTERLELYDIAADPGELHDLMRARPEVGARLGRRLEARRALDGVDPFESR